MWIDSEDNCNYQLSSNSPASNQGQLFSLNYIESLIPGWNKPDYEQYYATAGQS